ncbi:MAG TPA: ribosome biogenesis GTPase Der [Chloroflexota bacterium]|nr:ribosome biogenesis GTPase Der [Chloroflexota bacterium]
MTKPLIALVGRPNVGKSTLFNRLVGERVAIVEDVPGTTRDRLYGEFEWNGRELAVVDTGGLLPDRAEPISEDIYAQAQVAIEEAEVIVFLVDVRTGATSLDREIADLLRRTRKPVVVAVNKADNVQQEIGALEFHELGLGDPVAFSALRGISTGDLLDRVVELVPPAEVEPSNPEVARVAIVGRPNVGKSSLLNVLAGENRSVVSPVPGTTRDAVDTDIVYDNREIVLVDTAGIRRPGKVGLGIERYSVLRAMRAISRADVAVLVIDATQPLVAQDAHVAGFVQEEGKGLVVAVNKWDAVEKESNTMAEYERSIRHQLRFMPYAPMVFISAKTGQRVERVLDAALSVREEREKRVPTGPLNQVVRHILAQHQPPSSGGRQLKIYYVTQVGIDPPAFVFMVNDPELVHFSFRRFMENRLREQFGFAGTPLRLYFRARGKGRT